MKGRALRFDRGELAGAFGDLGTDFPLLVGLALACGLDGGSVLAAAGAAQLAVGFFYRMPMPVEPLKAMAAIAIAQRLAPGVIAGAGLAVGAMMLALTATGLLEALARAVPKTVVRGVQCGLGLQLAAVEAQRRPRAHEPLESPFVSSSAVIAPPRSSAPAGFLRKRTRGSAGIWEANSSGETPLRKSTGRACVRPPRRSSVSRSAPFSTGMS